MLCGGGMDTETIKRYTNLASLIAILKNRELTLLDPSKWEDKNDAYYLLKYGEKKGFKSLYVLCFTRASETSHHWKIFAPGADGVCIKMNADRFLSHLKSIKEIKHGAVEYKIIDEVEKMRIGVNRLPFIKRYAFRNELEYRVILGKKREEKKKSLSIGFEIPIIEKVILSNYLPRDLRKPMVELLKSIDGCSNLSIHRSTLNENARWKKAAERAT
jgi:hypothetical protein